MLAAPGLELPVQVALPAAGHPHRSARRTTMTRWRSTLALVVLAMLLGLLQGARTALGRVPLTDPPAVHDIASPPAGELDPDRGRCLRPPGSTAMRPSLSLRPLAWWPTRTLPVAQVCAARGEPVPSCGA